MLTVMVPPTLTDAGSIVFVPKAICALAVAGNKNTRAAMRIGRNLFIWLV